MKQLELNSNEERVINALRIRSLTSRKLLSHTEHISHNWNEEPFARGAYLNDQASSSISSNLFRSIDNKVYFAGDSYTQEDDWSSVHVAARAARDAVRLILN